MKMIVGVARQQQRLVEESFQEDKRKGPPGRAHVGGVGDELPAPGGDRPAEPTEEVRARVALMRAGPAPACGRVYLGGVRSGERDGRDEGRERHRGHAP